MAKIFSKNQGPEVDVKRNTFDLSYGSHVTGKIGDLIPVFCQEVIPGDSFEIDPKFGLRFNPTVFPIQTKMHGIMHFFYVRNRNLYKDWQEYIGRTKDDAVMPWLKITEANAKDVIGTGSLGDYLGVPTTLTGDYAKFVTSYLDTIVSSGEIDADLVGSSITGNVRGFHQTAVSIVNRKASSYIYVPRNVVGVSTDNQYLTPFIANWHVDSRVNVQYRNSAWTEMYGYTSKYPIWHPIDASKAFTFGNEPNLGSDAIQLNQGVYLVFTAGADNKATIDRTNPIAIVPISLSYTGGTEKQLIGSFNNNVAPSLINFVNNYIGNTAVYASLAFDPAIAENATLICSKPGVLPTDPSYKFPGDSMTFATKGVQVLDSTTRDTVGSNPFVVHGTGTNLVPKIKLNALPFRAYESIYNYFYRDETVDPFKIDGKDVYNDFIPTHEGGPDTTKYMLHQKNWERDYYTSCQVSPQQGTAPLVGISASGTFTFDDGTNEYTAQMKIGDDGETITGISTYSPDMPKGSLRQLMDVVTNGISINDLRNVNSLQRWLETNIRRGYKYVDQIYSHFGVNPAFKANDMPEFLGGIHTVGDVNQVTNMTSDGLGEYAGQLTMFGGSDNKIRTFCDEHGYIIGIMCVFPEPVYSQMLPKHFTKTETPLDFFFPEFGHIGMQPITYNEVTPLEVAASDAVSGTDTINDTFGYQRAWADYLANNDQAHGDFRTNLSEFVVARVFNEKPELGHDFIAIDDDDINDVFVTTDNSDKMLGELRFDVKAKRPIPMYGIPSIE